MYTPIIINNLAIEQLPVSSDLSIKQELMGADEIDVQIELSKPLVCPIGAHINYQGRPYTINTIPSPQVTGDASGLKYNHSIVFESDLYRLYDKILQYLNNKTFPITADLSELAYLIVSNINTIDSGWSVGITEDLGMKTIQFDNHTCRTALDTIAEAFTCEWYLSGTGKTINFVKQAGNTTSLIFKYGRGNGLYSLGYQYQSDKNIVTRAFGYGGSRNLPKNYRNGATQLMFDGLYLENNVYKNNDPDQGFLYKVKEGSFVDEDIFPSIDGHVSAVSTYDPDANTFTIADSSLAFNLNTYFSTDTPKVSFTSGQLQGQVFEISSYDATNKVIKLNLSTDSTGKTLPDDVRRPVIGDMFVLVDMYMPDEVVTAAEDKLKAKTLEWLLENSIPQVLYSLELDPLYARDNGISLKPGDKITVQDEALGINTLIRVTSITYPILFPDVITPDTKITATIANFIPYTRSERVLSATIDNQKDIQIVNRINAEKARLNALNFRKLQSRIFNPDGSLFTGADSLVAGMGSFGYDSQNLNLNNVIISPNLGADANAFKITAGGLIHYIYKIDGLGYTWVLTANTWTGLDPLKFYYVYAKCSKVALTGTWEISETPVLVNDIPGYYAFNLGILYEVNTDGYRTFQSTKGVTTIVGDQITSGLIQDISGQNYINLTNGKFNMGDADSGIDWDVTTPGTLTIRGALASKVIEVGSDGVVNARISGITDVVKPGESIRFAAGASDQFKVQDDGKMFSTAGMIGNWEISGGGIINDDGSAYIIARNSNSVDSPGNAEARIGTNVFPATTGAIGVAYFENGKTNVAGTNYGAVFDISGGVENIALEVINGDERIKGDTAKTCTINFYVGSSTSIPSVDGTGVYTVPDGYSAYVLMKIVNGRIMGAISMSSLIPG